ncbi:MAG: TRAP transporter small permease [Alphaproteobacteria bacterium]|nr:TRAP transporter small permease [Alphaproteobacteria bacterium]
MLNRFNSTLVRVFGYALSGLFAGLILVVFIQVVARNILQVPMIWTLDMAQLLFSWCIFLGAALAFRQGQHYVVDIWPPHGRFNLLPVIIPVVASAIVIYVLVWNGYLMSQIGLNRTSPALGISEFWFFVPIPLGGVCMALFLIETTLEGLRK